MEKGKATSVEVVFDSDLVSFGDNLNIKLGEIERDGSWIDDIKFSENENGYIALIIIKRLMPLTRHQAIHIRDITMAITKRIDTKYRKGQKEHGGDIWTKAGMLENAMDEVSDLVTYLHTIRDQLIEVRGLCKKSPEAMIMINRMLNKPND